MYGKMRCNSLGSLKSLLWWASWLRPGSCFLHPESSHGVQLGAASVDAGLMAVTAFIYWQAIFSIHSYISRKKDFFKESKEMLENKNIVKNEKCLSQAHQQSKHSQDKSQLVWKEVNRKLPN